MLYDVESSGAKEECCPMSVQTTLPCKCTRRKGKRTTFKLLGPVNKNLQTSAAPFFGTFATLISGGGVGAGAGTDRAFLS